jgi:hypothetical protein
MHFDFSKSAKEDVRHGSLSDADKRTKVPQVVAQAVPRNFEVSARSSEVFKEVVAIERAAGFDVALPHPHFGVLTSRFAHPCSLEEPRVAIGVPGEMREHVRP